MYCTININNKNFNLNQRKLLSFKWISKTEWIYIYILRINNKINEISNLFKTAKLY
jgi:hypothetical protein